MGRQRHHLWNQDDPLTTAEKQVTDRQRLERLLGTKVPDEKTARRLLTRMEQLKTRGLVS